MERYAFEQKVTTWVLDMRIVVNDIAASEGGGVSILRQLYQYIVSSDDKNEWIFLLSQRYIDEKENVHIVICDDVKKSRFNRLKFDFIYGKKFIESFKPDVVFYLQNTLVRGISVPQVMYMDQSIPFQRIKNFSFLKKEEFPYAIYQHLIGKLNYNACKKANRVIVQTEWLKDAIVKICKIDERHIHKIYPDLQMDVKYYNTCNLKQNNRFFYPASDAIYKNHVCIKEAIKLLGDNEIQMFLTLDEKICPQSITLGRIEQKEVYEYMQNSVLVFPSYIESYGLPLEEARKIGTLILAADTPFAREILKDYKNAYFFSPFKPEELADLMKRVLIGEISLKQDCSERTEKQQGWKTVIEVMKELVK